MGCFPWGKDSTKRSKHKTKYNALNQKDDHPETALDTLKVAPAKIEDSTKAVDVSLVTNELEANRGMNSDGMIRQMNAKAFKFSQIVDATENFKRENYLGQGGFGKVYKGKLKDTGELLAFKQLDCDGTQGIREFVVEVLTLSLVDHPNLVKLVGYCVDEGQKLLVYEYMPLGSLEAHLHGPKQKLDWNTRMKIAAGAAKGLAYLHDTLNPPIIYRDLKCSNLLLGEDYHPKLSDFGLAKVGPTGNNTHVSTRVMGTYGYCAPEYAMTGQLTFKSDIYSLGVFLLEIITGRKAIDNTRSAKEHNLVSWARPLFKDKKNIFQMVDPALKGQYPTKSLYKAFATAVMCVQEQPTLRPLISEVVKALDHIVSQPYNPPSPPAQNTPETPYVS